MHTSNVMMTKYRTGRQKMRDGIEIAYWEAGSGPITILLLHGWACDHTFLLPQLEHFSRSHRVIAVDLRGHGQSDAPASQYALAEFAEDIHELITARRVSAAVVVGHSMGGQVALELVARHPDDLSAICLIDSVLFPSVSLSGQLRCILPELAGPEYLSVLSDAAGSLFIETDDPARRAELLERWRALRSMLPLPPSGGIYWITISQSRWPLVRSRLPTWEPHGNWRILIAFEVFVPNS
jgi:pimeloyl-ACP methyl ester carboxylesterase